MFVSFHLALNDLSHLLGYLKSNKAMRAWERNSFYTRGKNDRFVHNSRSSNFKRYNLQKHYVNYELTATGHVCELQPKTISKRGKTLHNASHSLKTLGKGGASIHVHQPKQPSISPLILHWWKQNRMCQMSYTTDFTPHLLKLNRMASYSPGSSLMIFTAASSPVEMLRACRIQTQGGKSDLKRREWE